MTSKQTTHLQRWPLNESQRRALSIRLAGIEQDLRRLTDSITHPPTDGRMIHYVDPFVHDTTASVNALGAQIQQAIRQLADDLQLPPHEDSITHSLAAALLLDEIDLVEIEPSRLRGYGEVDAATADYLNHEVPRLRALIATLTESLTGQNHDGQLPSHT